MNTWLLEALEMLESNNKNSIEFETEKEAEEYCKENDIDFSCIKQTEYGFEVVEK